MKQKETIVVDVDDTLLALHPSLMGFANQRLGLNLTHDDYTDYDLSLVWGVRPNDASDLIQEYYVSDWYQSGHPPIDEARYVLPLLKQKYRLVVATARPYWHRHRTESFLENEFPGVFDTSYFISGHKTDTNQPTTKLAVCQKEKATYIIDDGAHHVLDCAQVGIKGLLMDTPWNKSVPPHPLITRVKNWHDVGHHLL